MRQTGATVVLADSTSDDDFSLDPAEIERLAGPRTRAVVVLHDGGHPADMDAIHAAAAAARDLLVIEDAAHAVGAELDGRRCGTIGDAGCFSFFPSKNITTGEGGTASTRSAPRSRSSARTPRRAQRRPRSSRSLSRETRRRTAAAPAVARRSWTFVPPPRRRARFVRGGARRASGRPAPRADPDERALSRHPSLLLLPRRRGLAAGRRSDCRPRPDSPASSDARRGRCRPSRGRTAPHTAGTDVDAQPLASDA